MFRRVEYAVCRTSTAAEMEKDLNILKFGSTFFSLYSLTQEVKHGTTLLGLKKGFLNVLGLTDHLLLT